MLNVLTAIQSEYGVRKPVDDSLILTVAQGDMNAFHELYEAVSKSVYGFALSITKNSQDAEDILQETFLRIYHNAPSYIPQGKPMAWILTITRNLSLEKLRNKKRFAAFDEARPEEIDFSAINDAESKILLETVFSILSDAEKQILILHAVSGMKHREIAKLLDLSTNTVLSKYHRAIKKIRNSMGEENS